MTLLSRLRVLETPRFLLRAGVRLSRWVSFPHCTVGRGSGAWTRIQVEVKGRAVIGDRVLFLSGLAPCEVRVAPGASLSIGDDCLFNYGVTLSARHGLRIGARCMFGSFSRLSDEDCTSRGPVTLGDDVWVAHGAVIGPGVTIGDGAVISAGAVVTGDVPPRTLAMGSPARIVPLSMSAGGLDEPRLVSGSTT